MIKVVRNKEKEIAVGELTDSHFIGVQYASLDRGLVVKLSTGVYVIPDNQSHANRYCSLTTFSSIQKAVGEDDIIGCYVFETAKELFSWVANGEVMK